MLKLTYGYASSRDNNFDPSYRADDFRIRQFLGVRPPATEGTRWWKLMLDGLQLR